MGRPPTKPKKLKDGFYIEVRNKRSNSGVKVRRDTREQMEMAIKEYERSKDVIVIGEIKNGVPIEDPEAVKKEEARLKKEAKEAEELADLDIDLDDEDEDDDDNLDDVDDDD